MTKKFWEIKFDESSEIFARQPYILGANFIFWEKIGGKFLRLLNEINSVARQIYVHVPNDLNLFRRANIKIFFLTFLIHFQKVKKSLNMMIKSI